MGHPRPVRLRGADVPRGRLGQGLAGATSRWSSTRASPSTARSVRPPVSATCSPAPTIVAHGNERQKQEDLLRILNGQDAWCQLFSEPGAGSDLASLTTKAVKDGDEWIITGQKVWTSTAQLSNLGMLIARTDPDLPKHKGITYFKFDMTQPGVEIRPLREMTGRAMFNEVFIDNARVHDDDMIGGLNNGWAAANTTLMAERAGLGTGGSGAAGNAFPGPIAGQLDDRVGDHVGQIRTGGAKMLSCSWTSLFPSISSVLLENWPESRTSV